MAHVTAQIISLAKTVATVLTATMERPAIIVRRIYGISFLIFAQIVLQVRATTLEHVITTETAIAMTMLRDQLATIANQIILATLAQLVCPSLYE